jgi:polyribonucleotide nucleotidyltransferase
MERAVPAPKKEMKDSAPRFGRTSIPSSLIGKLIGPQGSNIKALEKDTGAKVSIINDDGDLAVFGQNKASYDAAIAHIEALTNSIVNVGSTYLATVKEVLVFGAVLIAPGGEEGLMHVSEFAHERTENANDVYKAGDQVEVKCVAKDARGSIKWSRKALLPKTEAARPPGREKPRFTVAKKKTDGDE